MQPRATEILTLLEGSLFIGFVTSNPKNKLISKVLEKGDVLMFPMGLPLDKNDVSISALSSQNPGQKAYFSSNPMVVSGRVLRGRNLRTLVLISVEDVKIKLLSEPNFTYRYNYTVRGYDDLISSR
ncbi:hypothetical protein LguiB_004666 [Lonicera macranthoides]